MKKHFKVTILAFLVLIIGGVVIKPTPAGAICAANPNVAPSGLSFSVGSVSGSANSTNYSIGYSPGCDNGFVLDASYSISIVGYSNTASGSTTGCQQMCLLTTSDTGTLNVSGIPTGTYTANVTVENQDGNSTNSTTTFTITQPTGTIYVTSTNSQTSTPAPASWDVVANTSPSVVYPTGIVDLQGSGTAQTYTNVPATGVNGNPGLSYTMASPRPARPDLYALNSVKLVSPVKELIQCSLL